MTATGSVGVAPASMAAITLLRLWRFRSPVSESCRPRCASLAWARLSWADSMSYASSCAACRSASVQGALEPLTCSSQVSNDFLGLINPLG